MTNVHSCDSHFLKQNPQISQNYKRVSWVLWITVFTMVVEIYFGYSTGSMALLADGWHMASHAAALGITYLTYRLAIHPEVVKNFNFGGGKMIALGGFTSSVILLIVVLLMAFSAIEKLVKPTAIQFDEALLVSAIGLIVNLVSALLLKQHHSHDHHNHQHHSPDHLGEHDHHHSHDHNISAAYLHVVADAFTSVGAIGGLLAAKFYGLTFLDPVIALVSSVIILKWAYGLIKETGWELLDGHAKGVNYVLIKKRIEGTGSKIVDLHVWKIAPQTLSCELVVVSAESKGVDFFRDILKNEFSIAHSVIEERVG